MQSHAIARNSFPTRSLTIRSFVLEIRPGLNWVIANLIRVSGFCTKQGVSDSADCMDRVDAELS